MDVVPGTKNLCRLCMYDFRLKNRKYVNLFSELFTEESKKAVVQVLSGIKSCYNIEVSKNDGITSKVCENCVALLEVFYQTQLYVQGINAAYVSTKNFNSLFSAPLKGNELKSENTDSSCMEESDQNDNEEEEVTRIKVGCSNEILSKRTCAPAKSLGKSPLELDEFRTKFEPYKKQYKVKNQIINKTLNKMKKRGRPPKRLSVDNEEVNGHSDSAMSSSKDTNDKISVPLEKEQVPESSQCNEYIEMENDEEFTEDDGKNEIRVSSGRKVKPICRKDFVNYSNFK